MSTQKKPTHEEILKEPAGRRLDGWVSEFVFEFPLVDLTSDEDKQNFPDSYPMFCKDGEDCFFVAFFSTQIDQFVKAIEHITKKKTSEGEPMSVLFDIQRNDVICAVNAGEETLAEATAEGNPANAMPLAGCRAVLIAVLPEK